MTRAASQEKPGAGVWRHNEMTDAISLSADELIRYWLLNVAVEYSVWLGRLFPAVQDETLNVKPIPHCTSEDYARGLIDLFNSGMISLSSEVPGDDVQSSRGVAQILDRFLQLSNEDPVLRRNGRLLPMHERIRLPGMAVSFELSSLGGEAWEKVANPDWTRFISVSTVSTSGELVSSDRDLLIAYMGLYPEVNGERIQLETVAWETRTDYEILYWKRLPFVYHASFVVEAAKKRWAGPAPSWFLDWWLSTRSWRKQPWELPGWPSES
jgi:hypothetical protein